MGTSPVALTPCYTCGRGYVGSRCRRRQCPDGREPWARDVWTVLAAALHTMAYVRLVVITAPGQDVLPWDPRRCKHRTGVACSGRIGCRIDKRAAELYELRQVENWRLLRQAVVMRCKRAGYSSPLIALVLEDQQRGALHWNVVLEEGPAASLVQEAIVELAPSYGFGFVDRKLNTRSGIVAASYLSGYLTAKGGKKENASVQNVVARTSHHRRIWWVSPRLTQRTHVTMTNLRCGRRVMAARDGLIEMPAEGTAVVDWTVIDVATGAILHRVWDAEHDRTGT